MTRNSGRSTGHGSRFPWKNASPLAALLLLVSPLVGCERSAVPRLQPPNILLVTIDTLRVDHLGSYGYRRNTTPFLDRIAAEGVLFTRAYSVSSWTVPSMASLFTGLHPQSHGVVHGLVKQGKIFGQEVLSGEHRLLAELLKQAGYRTYGIAASLHLASEYGFGQGFDRYESVGFSGAVKVLAVVRSWRKEILEGTGPYFLFLHFFDPHDPYRARQPWMRSYSQVADVRPEFELLSPRKLRLYPRDRSSGETPIDEALALAEAAYDSEINYTDRAVGEVFEILGVSPDHLIVVTSDHGEEFFEHQDFGHAGTLYEEQIRIPLILRLPGREHAGTVIRQPVSLIDILPSVLDYLGLEPPEELQGISFLDFLEGGGDPARPILADLDRPHTELGSVVLGHWKYIHDFKESAEHRLFDLSTDPEEQTNLLDDEQRVAARLARILSDSIRLARSERRSSTLEEVPAEAVDQMRALGYVD